MGGIIYSIGGMAPIGAGQGLLRQSVRTTSILLMRGDEEGVVVGVRKGNIEGLYEGLSAGLMSINLCTDFFLSICYYIRRSS